MKSVHIEMVIGIATYQGKHEVCSYRYGHWHQISEVEKITANLVLKEIILIWLLAYFWREKSV